MATETRARRSDARRNTDALLDVARAMFAAEGVDVPAKRITDEAGVGVGTLYRHFPKRSDLIVAVLQQQVDALATAADDLADAPVPWDALAAWIDEFTRLVATKRGLAVAIHSGDPAYDGLADRLFAEVVPAADRLLQRAVDAGAARGDVAADELLLTIVRLCQPIRDGDDDQTRRMVQVFVDGLRREHPARSTDGSA